MEGDDHMAGEHMADAGHMESTEHSEGGAHAEGEEHGVPAEAMAVENPVTVTAESIAAGAATYTQYCAVCHGNEGKGDGPGAAALNPKPADFSAEHVQVLSDGGLFWFISNGVPDSAMPPWGGILSEEQRWEVVNFLRTFKGE
ncbi:MAG: cytochrome c [Chloroflexi bacterium]|nr:cytochrome c [Chloroflexota bacterium]